MSVVLGTLAECACVKHNQQDIKVMKTSGKSKFLHAKPFPSGKEKKKKDYLIQNLFWDSERIDRQAVLCARVFSVCLAHELGPYSTQK